MFFLKPWKSGGEREKGPSKTSLLKYTSNGEPVVAIIVVRGIHRGRIDVEVVHIVTIVASRRPEVAVGATIAGGAIIVVARERGT